MNSGPAYLDLNEATRWMHAQLEKQGLTVSDKLVLRILHLETQFMTMVNLTQPGSTDRMQGGHIHRQACWVLEPTVQSEADQQDPSEGKGEK